MTTSSISVTIGNDGIVSLQGELLLTTIEDALKLGHKLFRDSVGDLTIDLAGVSRGDSAGLALLIHWLRELHSRGRQLSFDGVPSHLLRLAEASDLTNILSFSKP